MSPRGSSNAATSPSSRPSTAPYARRSTSQPKSSRQQFSACGACRMRRVRCDLKDLPVGFVGPHPACSNCKERGIKCVDEFADVKAVKLLRRGRRLQQVEAIYGKTSDHDPNSSSANLSRTITIPTLHPDFFASSFWRWFSIQRPILDPNDFPSRFASHLKGSQTLTSEGALIAMLLVTWASSFGLDERGYPESSNPQGEQPTVGSQSAGSSTHPVFGNYPPPGSKRRQWKMRTETYIREILELIDLHGVLRRPTLDGVRVLLLLLPLLEDAQPLERLVIYEATLSQVQALCVVSAVSPPNYEDAATRARLFWYAYTQEGVLTGVRGGRFVLSNEDLDIFQRTLPAADHPSPSSPPLDAVPNMSPYHLQESSSFSPQEIVSRKAYLYLMHASAAPLDLSNICRKVHTVLTGIKATRRAEDHHLIDANGMRDIWRGLDRCWQELDSMKQQATDRDNAIRRFEINQYVSGWQIFIFECHNVIRESLKHFAIAASNTQVLYDPSGSSSRPSSHSSSSSPYLSPEHLHVAANRRCLSLLPRIINIVRTHSPRENGDIPCIFRWDANLVRDGVFFAAYLVANLDGEFVDSEDSEKSEGRDLTVDEGVSICLTALATMRWGFSKSEEREDTIKMIWENRKLRRQGQVHHLPLYDSDYPQSSTLPGLDMHLNLSPSPHMGLSTSSSEERPMLPPLNLFISQRRVESAPSTACSTDDRGTNWPSYTPPGTGTSVATSTGTGYSRRGSPVFANLGSFKASEDVFYNGGADVDQFSYNVPVGNAMIRDNSAMVSNATYGHRPSSMGTQTLAASNATNYMVTPPFNVTHPSNLTHADFHSCPQFGENCNGAYH